MESLCRVLLVVKPQGEAKTASEHRRPSLLRDSVSLLAGGSACPYLIFLNKNVKLLNAAMEFFVCLFVCFFMG